MKDSVRKIYDLLFERHPEFEPCRESVLRAYESICKTYRDGGCVFTCGNGGSCADSEHIVGELMKSFMFRRNINKDLKKRLISMGNDGKALADKLEGSLPAVSLCGHPALSTAFLNDADPKMTFAEQLLGLARKGDTLIILSTSGNSENCVYAALLACVLGVRTVALTGMSDSRLSGICEITIKAPEYETFKVQECHLPIYHTLCAMTEETFFEHVDLR